MSTSVARDSTLDEASIVHAAAAIVETDGVDALTTTAVANQLGVSQPALYRHVDGLAGIWRGLGIIGREQLAETLAEASIGRSGTDAVVATAHAWRRFALTNPGLYNATDRYSVANDEILEAAVERVVGVLAMTLRAYELDEEATIDAARALRSACHGFVHLEMGDGHPLPQSNDASYDRMIRLLCEGFARLSRGESSA